MEWEWMAENSNNSNNNSEMKKNCCKLNKTPLRLYAQHEKVHPINWKRKCWFEKCSEGGLLEWVIFALIWLLPIREKKKRRIYPKYFLSTRINITSHSSRISNIEDLATLHVVYQETATIHIRKDFVFDFYLMGSTINHFFSTSMIRYEWIFVEFVTNHFEPLQKMFVCVWSRENYSNRTSVSE